MSLRYLALGDSYTIGDEVDPAERYPNLLARRLRELGIPMDDPDYIAQGGWTTAELMTAIQARAPRASYDLVTLLIGVNNQYRGLALEAYRREFAALLDRAVMLAGSRPQRVIVLSIPDWGVTPFAKARANVSAEIDAFNAVNFETSARRRVHYVDITPLSREALHNRELLAFDGLHPSAKMYAQWVELLLPTARAALAA